MAQSFTHRQNSKFESKILIIQGWKGDRKGEGIVLSNFGNAHAALGEAHKAIEYYEQALVIGREIGDRKSEGEDLWNMSQIVDELGDRTRAIALAEAALKIFETIESPYVEKARIQLAEWSVRAGT